MDEKFLDPQVLWNCVENFEKRKDSQVGDEHLLALPDDECITLEDKKEIVRRYIKRVFTDRGYGVHVAIHQAEKQELSKEEKIYNNEQKSKNSHAHILVTPRRFNDDGDSFNIKKNREDKPQIKKGLVVETQSQDLQALYTQFKTNILKKRDWIFT